ncbi:MAG TPA: LssY C-terminal domain-containing protein [Oscillatoriaceae cyanobacterium]
MFKPIPLAMVASVVLLAGCGYDGAATPPLPPAPDTPTQQVGIPSSYSPGQPLPGEVGTPSLTKLEFPQFTHTDGGAVSDPVNLMIAGSEGQVRGILHSAGWQEADPITLKSAAKIVGNFITGGHYPTAPVSDLTLYGRKQDFAYERDQGSIRSRDHLRIWRTPLTDLAGDNFWAIAATHDADVKFNDVGLSVTHAISPDIDSERALVEQIYLASGIVAQRYTLQSLPVNYHGVNGGGDEYYTDGRVVVLELQ